MKVTRRILVVLSLIFLISFVLLVRHFLDLGAQYSALTFFRTSLVTYFFHASPHSPSAVGVEADDKIIVMARTKSQDTDWVERELPSFVLPFRKRSYMLTSSRPIV